MRRGTALAPAFSVVIPTRNREAILDETLSALLRAAPTTGALFEVVVVNDGDADLGQLPQRFPGLVLRVLRNAGRGAAAARNTGAAAARHELLLLLDDDILVGADNLARHARAQARFPRALVSGVARLPERLVEEARRSAFGRYKLRHDYGLDNATRLEALGEGLYRVAGVASFNLSVPRADFLSVGGFDARFPFAGCEDTELCFRARGGGLDTLLDAENVCFHNELDRLAPRPWLQRQYTGIQGGVLIAQLYPEGQRHPLYRANTPPAREDSIGLVLRKTLIAGLRLGPTPGLLLGLARVLERLRLPDAALFKLYDLLFLLHTANGFRAAQRRLASGAPLATV
jgi:glycosyltransferase involved in cell wall biosynthesis